VPRASALVGFRYLNIDLEKSNRANSFNADVEMFGPFLGVEPVLLSGRSASRHGPRRSSPDACTRPVLMLLFARADAGEKTAVPPLPIPTQ
jgi:hypothetical protein